MMWRVFPDYLDGIALWICDLESQERTCAFEDVTESRCKTVCTAAIEGNCVMIADGDISENHVPTWFGRKTSLAAHLLWHATLRIPSCHCSWVEHNLWWVMILHTSWFVAATQPVKSTASTAGNLEIAQHWGDVWCFTAEPCALMGRSVPSAWRFGSGPIGTCFVPQCLLGYLCEIVYVPVLPFTSPWGCYSRLGLGSC